LQWTDTPPIFWPVESTGTNEFLECTRWLEKKEERL
jgi:hypothetical protein